MEKIINSLTNEQKLEVVKKAIIIISSGEGDFLCTSIELATSRLYCDEVFFNKKLKGFELIPEIIAFKPENKQINSAWWIPNETTKKIRLEILETIKNNLENIK